MIANLILSFIVLLLTLIIIITNVKDDEKIDTDVSDLMDEIARIRTDIGDIRGTLFREVDKEKCALNNTRYDFNTRFSRIHEMLDDYCNDIYKRIGMILDYLGLELKVEGKPTTTYVILKKKEGEE